MNKLIDRKSQSAMENILTSGWAMLTVFLMISTVAYFGLLNADKFLPDRVEIGEKYIHIIPSGTNKFLIKNIGGSTLYDLWFNFSYSNCIPTEKYDIRPDEVIEFIILCEDMPERNSRFKSDFKAHYKTKKSGQILEQTSNGKYYVTGNYFSSNDLTAYWNMDKIYTTATESYVKDNSNNNNKAIVGYYGEFPTGEHVNKPNTTKGKFNNGISFYDRDSLEVLDNDDLDLGEVPNKEFTISVWFKNNKESDDTNPIISKSDGTGSTRSDYTLFNSSGRIGFGTGTNTDTCSWIEKNPTISNGWHNIIGIIKSETNEQGMKWFYLDGSLIENCTYYDKSPSNNANLEIGTRRRTNFFNGTMDEIMIFNRALTHNEVKSLYESGW